jgi:putative PIN family toxin of toxin-antitoxin system
MIRAVLDVNVLVSGFPAPAGIPAILIERWLRRDYELVLSEHILTGVARAWSNAYFRSRYHSDEAHHAIALLRNRATIVTPVTTIHGVADDEEDDLVLATAVAGTTSYLVTGDRGLLAIGPYQKVMIMTPRAFLAELDQQND